MQESTNKILRYPDSHKSDYTHCYNEYDAVSNMDCISNPPPSDRHEEYLCDEGHPGRSNEGIYRYENYISDDVDDHNDPVYPHHSSLFSTSDHNIGRER